MQSDIIDINVRTDCTFFCLFVVLGRPTGLPHIRLWTSILLLAMNSYVLSCVA